MMENRLEKIKRRDIKEIETGDIFRHLSIARSDRRWLLHEVDAQREELGRLIREQAVLKDEDNRLLHEVDRLRARVSELEGYVTDQEYFLDTPEEEEE